jgi:hypothetical protein
MGGRKSDWSYFGFGSWAERQAIDFREAHDLGPTDPLSSRRLAEHLEIPVLPIEDLPELAGPQLPPDLPLPPAEAITQLMADERSRWGACMLRMPAPSVPLILLNTGQPVEIQERDIMHEVAHAVCRHEYGGLVLTGGDWNRLRDPIQENEAIWLGACLQIPRAALLACLTAGESQAAICERFTLDPITFRYRLHRSGAMKQHLNSLRKLQGDLFAAA